MGQVSGALTFGDVFSNPTTVEFTLRAGSIRDGRLVANNTVGTAIYSIVPGVSTPFTVTETTPITVESGTTFSFSLIVRIVSTLPGPPPRPGLVLAPGSSPITVVVP